ncbi:MAG: DUF1579 family protein [Ignavibacteria bacterium]
MDDTGTGLAVSRGKYNPETNSIEMSGSIYDPIAKKDVEYKIVSTSVDENFHKMEMFSIIPEGTEFKTFLMEYAG